MRITNVERDNKVLELSIINDSLQKDVTAKEREIRRLNKDLQQYEQTMARMRDDINSDVPKKDAEVMAGMCCTGTECGDLVPVKDIGELLREETSKYRERIQNMEISLKVMPFESSRVKMRAVHKINLGLIEELSTLRRLCVAVDVERRDARLKLDLEGQIVKQMVRQLRQVKAQDACACVATSTPDGTQELPDETEISIIPLQPQPSITLSDEELEEALKILSDECHKQCPDADNVHEQSTLRLDSPNRSRSSWDQSAVLQGRSSRDTSQNQSPDPSQSIKIQSHDLPQEQNESPRKSKTTVPEQNHSPRKESISPVSEQNQSVRNQCDDVRSKNSRNIKMRHEKVVSEDLAQQQNESLIKLGKSSAPEQNHSPTPRKESTSPVSEQNQSVRNQCDDAICKNSRNIRMRYGNVVSDESPSAREQHLIQISEQSQSTKKQSTKNRHSPRKVIIDPVPELVKIPKKPIVTEPVSPRKESKTPALEQKRSTTDTSVTPMIKRNLNISETEEQNSSECQCDDNQKGNVSPEKSNISMNRSKKVDLKQSSRKHSKIPVPERARNRNANQMSEYDQTVSNPNEFTSKSKPRFMRLEHFATKNSSLSIDEESSEKPSTNGATNPSSPEQNESDQKSSLTEQNQSSTETSETTEPKIMHFEHFSRKHSCLAEIVEKSSETPSSNEESAPVLPEPSESDGKPSATEKTRSSTETCLTKPTFLRLNLYHYPKKDSSPSENEEISTKSCQCDCSCDETSPTDTVPKTSDQSTNSDVNQRWLVVPGGIKKSLEALRQTFLGKSEDYASIRLNKATDYPTSTSTAPDRGTTDNNTTESVSNSQSRERSSSLSKSKPSHSSDALLPRPKKRVKIHLPHKTNICDFCAVSEACEEDDDGCYAKDSEVQNPEKTDRSQGAPTLTTDDSELKSRSSVNRESLEADYNQTGTSNGASGSISRTKSSINRDSSRAEDEQNGTSADEKHGILSVKLLKEESTQDSGGGSSCAGVCDRYYRDKLMATLQILENKEETIRIQSSSLGVAEGRIAELTKRAVSMRQELDHKARELGKLRQSADNYQVDKSDASIMAEIQDAETQKLIVATLEDNLEVIEELYRECFYETVKQEDLIDLLRKSYIDVRLMERDKSEKITRLQNVILTQKKSLEQCQGMWERGSECPDVGEELGDILEQLRQLQAMLAGDCTCGLNEDNKVLKEKYEALEVELNQVRQRNIELDAALRQLLDQKFEKQLKDKERELQEIRKKLADVENNCIERSEACETLQRQLQQTQVLLGDKSAELEAVEQVRANQEATIKQLQQDLDKSERNVQEGLKKLAESSQSRAEQVLESQAAAAQLERRLRRAALRRRQLEEACRERELTAAELQAQLQEAQARGAALCAESRRVTASVRGWMRRKRALLSEQEEKIKQQEAMLRELQGSVGARHSVSDRASQSETEPCCSNSMPRYLASDASYPLCSRLNPTCRSETDRFQRYVPSLTSCAERENETASCSKCVSNRERLSGSEMASCSQAPVPPRRQKRQPSDDEDCPWSPTSRDRFSPDIRWARVSRHCPAEDVRARVPRRCPAGDVLARVEHLHAALAAGQRRWRRQVRR